MANDPTLARHFTEIETLLAQKFGASSGRLNRRAIKVGRRLPRAQRRDLGLLARAQSMAGHPKLSRMIDTRKTERAAERLRDWLGAVDVADRRKGRVLDLLGSLSFNLICLVVLLMVVLRWRGFI
ncbi:hypothetical protein FIU97_03255 [Roseivivax sp. THAF40]|uniref:hypothetical protein n=1 Tax=unclassified Roseivivax TaxID=2639302 RepID=UPI001268D692|nr:MULTISPECIES: hypothetical protein [unclassified Roseivivax]QFS81785.1 hypothetical protein FIV09_02995 [Roseivivax sp. THAF197b]QFT45585.1 hypothetical protein FIU97_03255 [Roseivivax sp. THAF40]